jgi:hypothetical protein
MRITETIKSPTKVVVTKYAPGLLIDFEEPTPRTDLDEVRRTFHSSEWDGLSRDALIRRASQFLEDLGLIRCPEDFEKSLAVFTGCDEFASALEKALSILPPGGSVPASITEQIRMLFARTGLLDRSLHHPTRLYCHVPNELTTVPADGTHFGYVLDGEANHVETSDGRRYPLFRGTYFSIPGAVSLYGDGRIVIVTRLGYSGLFTLGGEVSDWGRLSYIDGCSDTPLIQPPRKGDPCFNALFFPPSTTQTQHYHPSIRAGIVFHGEGTCVTPQGRFPLLAGNIFLLPPETWHYFETPVVTVPGRSALRIVTYHPDSDCGPTDEDHPMVNRTFCGYVERLMSCARSSGVPTGKGHDHNTQTEGHAPSPN